MYWKTILTALFAVCLAAAVGHSVISPGETAVSAAQPAPDKHDPIVASFERELDREPTPRQWVRRDSIDQDELYRTINTAQWTAGTQTARAVPDCPNDPANVGDECVPSPDMK